MTSGGTPTSYIGLIAANGSFVPGAFHYQPTNKPAQSARPAESGDGKSRNPPKLTIDNLQIRPKKN
ncbi:unnamed protein product [Clonostachys rosea f. rosea IK726]|uniref:Uncharacterized protein n=2 Tax=Bionectria ochroleuca TaxID=29856 RepID=A0A0B7KL90_BIOOC|nr:unnamed protein product [Clonostachys rosea f. rosea IK726]